MSVLKNEHVRASPYMDTVVEVLRWVTRSNTWNDEDDTMPVLTHVSESEPSRALAFLTPKHVGARVIIPGIFLHGLQHE